MKTKMKMMRKRGLDEFAAIAILPRKRNFSVPLELLAPA